MRDQAIDLPHPVGGKTERQTQLADAAVEAMSSEIVDGDDRRRRFNAGRFRSREWSGFLDG